VVTKAPEDPPRLPQLPLWGRWVLSLTVGVALMVALVAFVNANDADRATADNAQMTAESNREAALLVAEDQRPRVSPLTSGTSSARAITTAVAADMRRLIGKGTIGGPLTRTRCRAAGSSGRTRQAFRCAAVAASVRYPFLGVVDQRTRRVTYCKSDPPPVPSETVPVSPRCRA
jgi:hypothetical protein